MKKTLLITIHDLDAGGAQKSLVSFLNTLPEDIYDISLMVVNFRGIFISQIPVNVKVIEVPAWVKAMMTPLSSGEFWKGRMALFGPLKVFSILGATLFRNRKNASKNQYTWAFWKRFFRRSEQSFDIAMSYMDGFCNYYVIDKVKANKKVLWVHNDYSKLSAVARFDLKYFESADYVVSISGTCKQSLHAAFPTIRNKLKILENISSESLINKMSKSVDTKDEYFTQDSLKILSIGRLSHQKGFDIAIEVASILKSRGNKFKWYIIGDGPDRRMLEKKISDLKLKEEFLLLGLRNNPYPYISCAHIFAQTSRYEGKSIALDEAKILSKPVVVTDYPTASDSIVAGMNGIIVSMEVGQIADAIEMLLNDEDMRNKFSAKLQAEKVSNEEEILKYIEIL